MLPAQVLKSDDGSMQDDDGEQVYIGSDSGED